MLLIIGCVINLVIKTYEWKVIIGHFDLPIGLTLICPFQEKEPRYDIRPSVHGV